MQLGEDQDVAANRAESVERAGAGENLVSDPADIDDGAIGAGFRKGAGEAGDH